MARAVRAVHVVRLSQAWTHALSRHLDDAKLADLSHSRLCAVLRKVFPQAFFDIAAVLRRPHIDEIAHDHAAKVAQTNLSGDLINGFLVGLVRVGFAVARAARATAVYIDRNECFGLVKDKRSAGRQRNFARVDEFHLALDIERVKDRHAPVIKVHFRRCLRRNNIEKCLRAMKRTLTVDDNSIDRRIDRIANCSKENVALGVKAAWRANGVHAPLHHIPESREVLRIAGEFSSRGVETSGPQNKSKALGKVERVEDLPHLAASLLVVNFSAHTDVVHVRHHHEQSARNREVTRDGWPLRAKSFFEHLNNDFLAAPQRFLHHRARASRDLAADLFGLVTLAGEVLRMKIGDVEKAVRALAEVNECSLNSGLNVDNACLVDRANIG